jgi:arylsulfatase A-like enzyme
VDRSGAVSAAFLASAGIPALLYLELLLLPGSPARAQWTDLPALLPESLLLGAIFALPAASRWLPRAYLVLLGSFLALCCVSHRAFLWKGSWLRHGEIPVLEDFPTMAASFLGEVDAVFTANLAAALLALAFLRAVHRSPAALRGARAAALALASLGAVAALWLPDRSPELAALAHPPLLAFLEGAAPLPPEDLHANPTHPLLHGAPSVAPPLPSRAAGPAAHPNFLLLILESVGSLDFLREGRVDPALAPNLARHLERARVFPSMYVPAPATLRSWAALYTGGHSYGWANGPELARRGFEGPVLSRVLEDHGYSTAVLGSPFDFIGCSDWYRGTYRFQFTRIPIPRDAPQARTMPLNSWGTREEVILTQLTEWERWRAKEKPFFLVVSNAATHHPYASGRPGPATGSPRERWEQAVRYTDEVFGQLLERLREGGALENTVTLLIGDHGEAFGDRHPENRIHRNFLYEEVIRSFLVVRDPRVESPHQVDPRRIEVGDLMPTMLSLAGAPRQPVPGQDLFAPGYQERIRFFQSVQTPPLWGLVDGRWKYIGAMADTQPGQLFDLRLDSNETDDLARLYPERVQEYRDLTRELMRRRTAAFLARTARSRGIGLELAAASYESPGPHVLRLGVMLDEDTFLPLGRAHPGEQLVAFTKGRAFGRERTLPYEFRGPKDQVRKSETTYGGDSLARAWALWRGEEMDSGTWNLRLLQDDRVRLEASVEVDPASPVYGLERRDMAAPRGGGLIPGLGPVLRPEGGRLRLTHTLHRVGAPGRIEGLEAPTARAGDQVYLVVRHPVDLALDGLRGHFERGAVLGLAFDGETWRESPGEAYATGK